MKIPPLAAWLEDMPDEMQREIYHVVQRWLDEVVESAQEMEQTMLKRGHRQSAMAYSNLHYATNELLETVLTNKKRLEESS